MTVTLVGFPPTGGTLDENGLASQVHSTAKGPVGALYTAWDPATNNWSLVKYYQAGASIRQGDALVQDTSARNPNKFLQSPVTAVGQIPRGFAAAAVSNTGYYSYCYVAGYCPAMRFGSGWASNTFFALSGSATGALTSYGLNATLGTSVFVTARMGIVYSLSADSTEGLGSGIIQGFLL